MILNLKFENISLLNFVGDIHGEFGEIVSKITLKYDMSDSVNVLCGDTGIGFSKTTEPYHIEFKKLNKRLSICNNHIVLVRGNHCNPSYFNNEKVRSEFDKYSHIHLTADYSVISINNKINILCIGGSISIDRKYRIERMKNLEYQGFSYNPIYWEDEVIQYDEKKIDDINEKFPNDIHIIASHDCPSYCYPSHKNSQLLKHYLYIDDKLEGDLDKCRANMDLIFHKLKDGGQKSITRHYYGHYHEYFKEKKPSGIEHILLDCDQIFEHRL